MALAYQFSLDNPEGVQNFVAYKRIRKRYYGHKFYYFITTTSSVGLSFGGYLVTEDPIFLAVVIVAELGKLIISDQDGTRAKILSWSFTFISIGSGAIGLTASLYVEKEDIREIYKKQDQIKERIEFLRAEIRKPLNLPELNLTAFETDFKYAEFRQARDQWLKYASLPMKDWIKKNGNGKKGRRTGKWMLENQSKCKTYWCGKVIAIGLKFQSLEQDRKRSLARDQDKEKFLQLHYQKIDSIKSDRQNLIKQLTSLENEVADFDIPPKKFFNEWQLLMLMLILLTIIEGGQRHSMTVIRIVLPEWLLFKNAYKLWKIKQKSQNKSPIQSYSLNRTTLISKDKVDTFRKKTLDDKGIKQVIVSIHNSGIESPSVRVIKKHLKLLKFGQTDKNIQKILKQLHDISGEK